MKKSCSALLALALMLSAFTGCRRNVSTREDGMVTDPTVTTGTVATMPSTDTAPVDTQPSAATQSPAETDATGDTTPSDPSAPEGRARHAHPRDPMQRN